MLGILCIAYLIFGPSDPFFIVLKTNFTLPQWIVVKLGLERLYWNVTTDFNFNFIAEHGLFITRRLNYSPNTHRCEVFTEPESPYETDFIAYKS